MMAEKVDELITGFDPRHRVVKVRILWVPEVVHREAGNGAIVEDRIVDKTPIEDMHGNPKRHGEIAEVYYSLAAILVASGKAEWV